MSIDWDAPASVYRTEGEVRTDIAEGPLAAMVERFLAEPDEQRHRLVHRRDDFPGAY